MIHTIKKVCVVSCLICSCSSYSCQKLVTVTRDDMSLETLALNVIGKKNWNACKFAAGAFSGAATTALFLYLHKDASNQTVPVQEIQKNISPSVFPYNPLEKIFLWNK